MERLTSWNEDCVLINGHALAYSMRYEIVQMAEHLAAYEDIAELCGGLDRLRELAEADKDGRCVVLPCKVGDTVYQLRKKTHARGMGISPRIVSSALAWTDGSYALTHQGMSYCQSGDLGKTWFLTREEAERAMEGRKDD